MRILTYNCCALPLFTRDIPERLERIGAAIAALDPDVVALQEVFFPSHLELIRRQLPEHHVASSIRSWRSFGGGLNVLSRFPLRDPEFVRFRRQGSLLRYTALAHISRKGYLTTRIQPPDGPEITLVVSHPVADYNDWREVEGPTDRGGRSRLRYLWKLGAVARGDPYPALQAEQLAQLARHVADLPRDQPLVVAGDLNVPPHAPVLRELVETAELEDCMAGNEQPSFPAEPYYRLGGSTPRRIDYVLHRGGLVPTRSRYVLEEPQRLRSGDEVTLSDHFGVWVEFQRRTS